MKKVILATPRGFCAGVDRAIHVVEKAIEKFGTPIYVRHEIVHNQFVVDTLKSKGVVRQWERIKAQEKNNLLGRARIPERRLPAHSGAYFLPRRKRSRGRSRSHRNLGSLHQQCVWY